MAGQEPNSGGGAEDLADGIERLDARLTAGFPEYAGLVCPAPVPLPDLQPLLGEQGALVS